MLAKIIRWSGGSPFLVLLATLFIVIGGVVAVMKTPLDALPDLSDVQVIVYTEVPGQAPQVVEDQVTYPLTTAMLTVPKSKVVHGFSFFGASFVYVIFEDGTDIYWARSRVLEYLNFASSRLPRGVAPSLGPDATGVGWVYQYALLAKNRSLAELRTVQDWYVRYQLTKAPGVAEVASLGGFVQTYQVTVDTMKLRSFGIPLMKVSQVIRDSNRDVGGRVVEMAETEYMVRGKGYLRSKADIEMLVVKSEAGTPVLIRDIARVEMAPDERRALSELNGEGEVESGIVMARFGQNALEVIHNVKLKVAEISAGLPEGVSIQAVYDRSDLIHRAIDTLKRTLIEESLIVAAVCVVFLMHVRSALVAILMLPVGVLISFIAMRLLGMNSNLMSLGGIAIAIGAMVDAAIMERAIEKMKIVVPVTLLLIFRLLYLNFRRLTETFIVMLSVPFALVGGVWLMAWLDYNLSVAVAVGFIALAGVAAETGVVMLIYLDHAWAATQQQCLQQGRVPGPADLYAAVMEGAVERVRPKMMTVVAIMAGLLPIMWGTGTGSEVMSRIAAPMVGGMVSSTVLTLVVIPALYALVKQWQMPRAKEPS